MSVLVTEEELKETTRIVKFTETVLNLFWAEEHARQQHRAQRPEAIEYRVDLCKNLLLFRVFARSVILGGPQFARIEGIPTVEL